MNYCSHGNKINEPCRECCVEVESATLRRQIAERYHERLVAFARLSLLDGMLPLGAQEAGEILLAEIARVSAAGGEEGCSHED